MYPVDNQLCICKESLFIPQLSLIVIGDLQLGEEEELRSKGHGVVDRSLRTILQRLGAIIESTGAKRVLINGDLKHEFSRISQQEWSSVVKLFNFLKQKEVEIIIVKGNHDNMLDPIARREEVPLYESFNEEGFLFVHGHEVPGKELLADIHTIIISHEHPAVRLADGVRSELAKCFLVGEWQHKKLVVLPSFSESTIGTDVLGDGALSPLLKEKEKFAAYILVEEDVLSFGTVKDIKAALSVNGGQR